MSQYGWVAQDFSRDLGEDILIQIHDDGRFSGISFAVQLKSVERQGRLGKHTDHATHRFDSADLKDWADSNPLTVLMVWDVSTQRGWWVSVEDALKDLSARNPGWVDSGSATVRFPWANSTEDSGLARLREVVAQHAFPVVSRGKELEGNFTFQFPDSDDGREAQAKLQALFDHGDAFELDGRFIHAIQMSDWFERLFWRGGATVTLLQAGPSKSSRSVPMSIEIRCDDGFAACLPFVEFRTKKAGALSMTLEGSVRGNLGSITLRFERDSRKAGFQFELNTGSAPATDVYAAACFVTALSRGGTLITTTLSNGRRNVAEIPPSNLPVPSAGLLELLRKLNWLSLETLRPLTVPDGWRFSAKQVRDIEKLYRVCTEGVIVQSVNGRILVRFPVSELTRFVVDHPESDGEGDLSVVRIGPATVTILGDEIDLGDLEQTTQIDRRAFGLAVRDALARREPGESREVQISVEAAPQTERYLRWPRAVRRDPSTGSPLDGKQGGSL